MPQDKNGPWSRRPTPAKSRTIGPATVDDGAQTTAWEALVALECGQCGQAIQPGELFTWRPQQSPTPGAYRLKRVSVCGSCRPLHVQDTGAD